MQSRCHCVHLFEKSSFENQLAVCPKVQIRGRLLFERWYVWSYKTTFWHKSSLSLAITSLLMVGRARTDQGCQAKRAFSWMSIQLTPDRSQLTSHSCSQCNGWQYLKVMTIPGNNWQYLIAPNNTSQYITIAGNNAKKNVWKCQLTHTSVWKNSRIANFVLLDWSIKTCTYIYKCLQ